MVKIDFHIDGKEILIISTKDEAVRILNEIANTPHPDGKSGKSRLQVERFIYNLDKPLLEHEFRSATLAHLAEYHEELATDQISAYRMFDLIDSCFNDGMKVNETVKEVIKTFSIKKH